MKSNLKDFIVPSQHKRIFFDFEKADICAIVPTYKPEALTVRLVEDLVRWNPSIFVYVVDDCTPHDYKDSTRIFERIASVSDRVTLLRTPVNALKAGALNYALQYIFGRSDGYAPDVILTLDDDVVIERATVKNLVTELMSGNTLGAVCSQCRVYNKNKNVLTRLQGLEYVGFNAIRLADEGFFKGPLVMHGMLTAFRVRALQEAGLFAERHLIEDYEMTTRLKTLGWHVKSAVNAPASTVVPESFSTFWRQRTRWSYGGITVIARAKDFSSVLQDILGHGVFIATMGMVAVLLVSRGDGSVPPHIAQIIIALSFVQLAVWYVFNLWLMRLYKEKDWYDWMLRIALLPEFIYSYAMTVVLLGSYLFLFFNMLGFGSKLFRTLGYTESWGTRTS